MLRNFGNNQFSSVQLSTIVRALALGSVFLLYKVLPSQGFKTAFFICALAHYGLHAFSGRSNFSKLSVKRNVWAVFVPVIALTVAMFSFEHDAILALLLALHTAFNDVYVTEQPVEKRAFREVAFIGCRLLVNFIAFWTCLSQRSTLHFGWDWTLPSSSAIPLTAVLLVFYFVLGGKRRASVALFDALLFSVLFYTASEKMTMAPLGLYHVLFWLFQPIVFAAPAWRRQTLQQVVTISSLTVIQFFIVKLDYLSVPAGYFHITLTFFISRWNPFWLRRLLQPRQPAPEPTQQPVGDVRTAA